MENVNFFTPISFEGKGTTFRERSLATLSNYLSPFGSRQACVIRSESADGKYGVSMEENSSGWIATTFKVVSYMTVVLPIVALLTYTIMRWGVKFEVVDFKAKSEAAIEVSPKLLDKLEELTLVLKRAEDHHEITWLSKEPTRVFVLNEDPTLVFKFEHPADLEHRVNNIVRAQEVVGVHNLGKLYVPNAKIVEAGGHQFLAVERVQILEKSSAVEEQWREKSADLDETARQLALFIANSNWNNVNPGNIPLLADTTDVALINLKEVESTLPGAAFFGDEKVPGLLNCLFSQSQMETMGAIAKAHGKDAWFTETRINSRLNEVRKHEELMAHYEEKGILANPTQEIPGDAIDDFSIDLAEEVTIRNQTRDDHLSLHFAAQNVIETLNRALVQSDGLDSVKERRRVTLPTDTGFMHVWNTLGAAPAAPNNGFFDGCSWLRLILSELKELGHIVEILEIKDDSITVQL